MIGQPFSTLTGDDWKRSLQAARTRRSTASLPEDASGGFRCPVCQKLGVPLPQAGGGFVVKHRAGLTCAPAFTGGLKA